MHTLSSVVDFTGPGPVTERLCFESSILDDTLGGGGGGGGAWAIIISAEKNNDKKKNNNINRMLINFFI